MKLHAKKREAVMKDETVADTLIEIILQQQYTVGHVTLLGATEDNTFIQIRAL